MQVLFYHRFEVQLLLYLANQGSSVKTTFIMDKGKWTFHSLPFGIYIGLSAWSYVLGKVLVPCMEFALNYHDDIMIFSSTWEEQLEHLEAVFKWLETADLKSNAASANSLKLKYII